MSPSSISFPISFSSVCAVCELMWTVPGLRGLFVVGDDGFKEVAEALVTARVVLARDLQQQLFERVEAAQRVTRDGVGQARAQHHELLLALVLRGPDGAP